jgi:hypothetical protein
VGNFFKEFISFKIHAAMQQYFQVGTLPPKNLSYFETEVETADTTTVTFLTIKILF